MDIDKKAKLYLISPEEQMEANDWTQRFNDYNSQLQDLIVRFRKPVTYFESLKIMQESDWVLLIDANLSYFLNENIFFAATAKVKVLKLNTYDIRVNPFLGTIHFAG